MYLKYEYLVFVHFDRHIVAYISNYITKPGLKTYVIFDAI